MRAIFRGLAITLTAFGLSGTLSPFSQPAAQEAADAKLFERPGLPKKPDERDRSGTGSLVTTGHSKSLVVMPKNQAQESWLSKALKQKSLSSAPRRPPSFPNALLSDDLKKSLGIGIEMGGKVQHEGAEQSEWDKPEWHDCETDLERREVDAVHAEIECNPEERKKLDEIRALLHQLTGEELDALIRQQLESTPAPSGR
jgi:hypothetical protein